MTPGIRQQAPWKFWSLSIIEGGRHASEGLTTASTRGAFRSDDPARRLHRSRRAWRLAPRQQWCYGGDGHTGRSAEECAHHGIAARRHPERTPWEPPPTAGAQGIPEVDNSKEAAAYRML